MTETKILKWGIVSTGRIADKFCHDMAYVKNGTVAAVAARSLKDASDFAAKHNIHKAYQSYQSLFDDKDLDIIYIATPHTFHFKNVYDALSAGKHVLCEKPITISSQEFSVLAALAKQNNVFLMEAMWTYFLPSLLKAKEWVAQGRIGTIKHIKADFGYLVPYEPEGRMYNPDLAGGCLFDMGIYPLALAQYFNAGPLNDVVVKTQFAPRKVEKDVALLASSNGVTLSLASSFQCRMQNAALIIGDQGYIKIPNFWRAKSCGLYQLDEKVADFKDNSPGSGLHFEATAVGVAINNNQLEHPDMPHSVSLRLQQQLETIRASF
ncbi:MAG: Gfo/Idh/MocA family oxidoreductase [Paraglaciecola sp.]|uniref:Gfo/Idh/MocA family protein n=1 Tax=Paraglaciecola sp. TaxID=1920173 RepID=UPI003296F58F